MNTGLRRVKISPPFLCIIKENLYFCKCKSKYVEIMLTTTARIESTSHPISYYWNVVRDMDDQQKLELVTMLIDSVKPSLGHQPLRPYTMKELDAMLDEAEAAFEAGDYLTNDEVFHHSERLLAV